jgi:hypothetical protein
MMQDNTPINFYIKHFFIIFQIKKLQPIFDTFVPPCMYYVIRSQNEVLCAEAGTLAAERSFQYVRFRNEFVKI